MNGTSRRLTGAVLIGAAGWAAAVGCSRDVRLAGRKLRSVSVGTVTHYGVTLDKSATPEQVAYVALRAIRDDFLAKTPKERDEAIDVQLDLAAADFIQSRNRSGTPRDEWVFDVVDHWTPTVSHYVDDFDTDFEAAKARMKFTAARLASGENASPGQSRVEMPVRDPSGNPNASAVVVVWMVQEQGYWRVTHLGAEARR